MGIGNPLKGDDGAGPALTRLLEGRTRFDCIDAGMVPENHLERIVRLRPEAVLFVDALDFGGNPGSITLIDGGQTGGGGLSSHALPLRMLSGYLKARLGFDALIVGIQPASVSLARPLSPPVDRAVRRIARALTAWSGKPPALRSGGRARSVDGATGRAAARSPRRVAGVRRNRPRIDGAAADE